MCINSNIAMYINITIFNGENGKPKNENAQAAQDLRKLVPKIVKTPLRKTLRKTTAQDIHARTLGLPNPHGKTHLRKTSAQDVYARRHARRPRKTSHKAHARRPRKT